MPTPAPYPLATLGSGADASLSRVLPGGIAAYAALQAAAPLPLAAVGSKVAGATAGPTVDPAWDQALAPGGYAPQVGTAVDLSIYMPLPAVKAIRSGTALLARPDVRDAVARRCPGIVQAGVHGLATAGQGASIADAFRRAAGLEVLHATGQSAAGMSEAQIAAVAETVGIVMIRAVASAVGDTIGQAIPVMKAMIDEWLASEAWFAAEKAQMKADEVTMLRGALFDYRPGTGRGGAQMPCDMGPWLASLLAALAVSPPDAWTRWWVGVAGTTVENGSAVSYARHDEVYYAASKLLDVADARLGLHGDKGVTWGAAVYDAAQAGLQNLSADDLTAAAARAAPLCTAASALAVAAAACRGRPGTDGGVLYASAAVACAGQALAGMAAPYQDWILAYASLAIVTPLGAAAGCGAWGRSMLVELVRGQGLTRRPLYVP